MTNNSHLSVENAMAYWVGAPEKLVDEKNEDLKSIMYSQEYEKEISGLHCSCAIGRIIMNDRHSYFPAEQQNRY